MDECLLLDEYEDVLEDRDYGDVDEYNNGGDGSHEKKKRKGSHAAVELASDGETSLRIRDGQFGKCLLCV